MILIYMIILLTTLALFLGCDLSQIGRLTYRGGWKLAALVAGLSILQTILVLFTPGQTMGQMLLAIFSQLALAGAFLLNRHLPGAKLVALGIMLNTTVMLANGGWMPITLESVRYVHPDRPIELEARQPKSKNIILPRSETNLWLLSDIIPVAVPWRRYVISLGDSLLVVGVAQFIFQTTTRRKTPILLPVFEWTSISAKR